jgi:hypothetical protein
LVSQIGRSELLAFAAAGELTGQTPTESRQ